MVLRRAAGMLFRPAETFRDINNGSLKDAFLFYAALLLLNAVLSTLLAFVIMRGVSIGGSVIGGSVWMGLPGAFFGTLVSGFIFLCAGGLLLHLLVGIVGGGRPINPTFGVLMYGATPYLLLGWIPIADLIGGVWMIGTVIIGIREVHGMPARRAMCAGVIWGICAGIAYMALQYGFVSFGRI
ncbi:YIP1 family protein [Methanofollis fontis]|nr:YIP1 family protein [Methanofollis fontis]